MPWIAAVVAYVDGSGYLYCTACARRGFGRGEQIPMHADNSAVHGERCDGCSAAIEVAVPMVHVS